MGAVYASQRIGGAAVFAPSYLSASGGREVTAAMLETGSDTATGSASVFIIASMGALESGADTFFGSASQVPLPTLLATLAATESGLDTFAGSAVLVLPGLTVTAAMTETGADVLRGYVTATDGSDAPTERVYRVSRGVRVYNLGNHLTMTEYLSADDFALVDGHPTILKAPDSVKDYTVDFTEVLPAGVVIAVASVAALGLKVDEFEIVGGGKMIRAWLSGGAFRGRAKVTYKATFSDGRTIDPRTLYFVIDNVG